MQEEPAWAIDLNMKKYIVFQSVFIIVLGVISLSINELNVYIKYTYYTIGFIIIGFIKYVYENKYEKNE